MSTHQMWYKLRNELKYRELPVPSTFMTVGELRGLIIEHLGLPDGETVVLFPDEDLAYETPYPDVKQFPRGSRFRATRTTVEQLAKEGKQSAGQPDAGPTAVQDTKKPEDAGNSDAESEESEFGPDPWDRDAADRWKEKEKRTGKAPVKGKEAGTSEAVTPAPSRPTAATHIPDSQELPALTYPHQSRELTQHEWEEKLKPRRNVHADGSAVQDSTPSAEGGHGHIDQPQPVTTALVRAETRAVPTIAATKPSLLQQHPEIQYRCRSFLPQAPVELLYEVFGVGSLMKRSEWERWRADNAERNPPQESSPAAPFRSNSEDQRARSHSQRRSGSPRRRTSRDRSRAHSRGCSPVPSPHTTPRRRAHRSAHSPFEVNRWRDSDFSAGARQSSVGRSRRPASRDVDFKSRPPRLAARSGSHSSISPEPSRSRPKPSADAPAAARRNGSRSQHLPSATLSPPPCPTAPRRRNFDTQLPPKAPCAADAGAAAPRRRRRASGTPPPSHDRGAGEQQEPASAAASAPLRRHKQPPATRTRSPARSRSPRRRHHVRVTTTGRRQHASRGRSSSNSGSGSSSSSGRSSSSGSDSSGSARSTSREKSSGARARSHSRSRSRQPVTKARTRHEDDRDRGVHRSSAVAGKHGGQGGWRGTSSHTVVRERAGDSRRVAPKAERASAESHEELKRCALRRCRVV